MGKAGETPRHGARPNLPMETHWKYNLWRNALTNYLRMGVSMAGGLVTFRLLYQYFTQEQFGYWALLWSVFGMTVVLDFGMGSAAQRETAYCTAHGEWEKLSRLASTMVWSFALIGALIALIGVAAQPWFLRLIHASPANHAEFQRVFWIFFGALAIGFPTGLFNEILAGIQRLDLINGALMAGSLINVILVFVGVKLGWAMQTFVLIGVTTSLCPNIVTFLLIRRLIPKLSLNPRLFHFPSIKGVLSFSIVAYFITLTNIIISRTDQMVISVCVGVALVAIYQAGFKVAEVFGYGTQQMQQALSPAAAHLRAKGDHASLNELVTKTSRLTVLVSTPAFALCAAYLEPLIRLVTGLKAVSETTHWVGQLLLLSTYSFLLTNSCAKQILVMSGWERPLLRLSVTEAFLNLVLSVVLVFKLGVVGVAIGTLIPAVLVGWFGVLPLTLKVTGMRLGQWILDVFVSVFLPVAASLAVLALLLLVWPVPRQAVLWWIPVRGGLVMLPILVYAYRKRAGLF